MKIAYLKPEKSRPKETQPDLMAMYQADILKSWKKNKEELERLGFTQERFIEEIKKKLK